MIRLMVDSTCDLPEELMARYGILMLPLRVFLNGKDYRDKVEIAVDEVFAAMREGAVPKTAQASPEDIRGMLEGCCLRGEDVLYLAFSSAMSGTQQLAGMIAGELAPQYPDRVMRIVDAKGGSIATGLIALQTARMIADGRDFEQVAAYAAHLADHVEHIFTIADIGWLAKGGRVSRLTGIIGSVLDVRPILHVKNGMIEVFKKARGGQKAIAAVVEATLERIAAFPSQIIGIAHTDNLPGAQKLQALLREKTGAEQFIISKIGSVLGAHLGLNGLGVFFLNQRPDPYDSMP